ncbi:hypothetical protein HOD08_04590 [bacterium]|nr:hypothetical protein [bacterium]
MGASLRCAAISIVCAFFFSSNIFADIVCSSKKSRIKLMDSTSRLVTRTDITYDGTLEYTGELSDRHFGDGLLTLSDGVLEDSAGLAETSFSRANITNFYNTNRHSSYNSTNAQSIVWSPNEAYAATVDTSGIIRVFSNSGGSLTEVGSGTLFNSYGSAARTVSWSVNNYLAVGGDRSGSITHRVYSVSAGALSEVGSGYDHGAAVYSVHWNADGTLLAIGGAESGSVTHRVYTVDGGVLSQATQSGGNDYLGQSPVKSVAWHPTRNYLAVGGSAGATGSSHRVYASTSQGVLTEAGSGYNLGGANSYVNSLAWSDCGCILGVVGNRVNNITHKIYSIPAHNGILTQIGDAYDYGCDLHAIAFHQDSSFKQTYSFVALGGEDLSGVYYKIYQIVDDALSFKTSNSGAQGCVNGMDWKTYLVFCGSFYDYPATYKSMGNCSRPSSYIYSYTTKDTAEDTKVVEVNSSGNRLFCSNGSSSNGLKSYYVSGSSYSLIDTEDPGNTVLDLDLNVTETYLAVGITAASSDDISHRVYTADGSTLTLVDQTDSNMKRGGSVNTLKWSSDAAYLAVGGPVANGNTHRIYSADQLGILTEVGSGYNHEAEVRCLVWSSAGDYLAVGGDAATGVTHRIYSVDEEGNLSLVEQSGGYDNFGSTVYSMAWSSNGTYLAVSGHDENFSTRKTLKVYQLSEGAFTQEVGSGYDDYNMYCYDIAWSPYSGYLAAAMSIDSVNTIVLFSSSNGVLTRRNAVVIGDQQVSSIKWNYYGSMLFYGTDRAYTDYKSMYSYYFYPSSYSRQTISSSIIGSKFGTIDDQLVIYGSGNIMRGAPNFSSTVSLSGGSAELTLQLSKKLDTDISLNYGTVILGSDLSFSDGNKFSSSGTINFNGKTLHLGGQEDTWSNSLTMYNAGDIELHAKTNLTGTWYFSGGQETGGNINGNGNVLDLSSGGRLQIADRHSLLLSDVFVAGVDYNAIVFDGKQATVTLSKASLGLDSSVEFTTGRICVEGSDCTIITGANTLTFDSNAVLTVDGVTLWYDTKLTGDRKNIRRGDGVAYSDDGKNIDYQNNGAIKPSGIYDDGVIIFGDITLTRNEVISTNRTMTFIVAATLTGGGYAIEWARGSSGANAMILGGNAVTLTDVVLRNFHTAGVSGVANLSFGTGCSIELAADEYVTAAWNFTAGTSTIYGKGCKLTLSAANALNLSSGVTLNLQDVRVAGITETNDIQLAATGNNSTAKLVVKDSQLVFADEYPFPAGSLDISGDVKFAGRTAAASFGLKTSGTMTILADSTLTIDRNFTFTYEGRPILGGSNPDGMERLKFANSTTSRLYLDGCEFRTSTTGAKLTGGRLIIDDKVTFSSGAHHDASAIVIATDLTVEVLKASTLDMYGYVAYEAG